jgi:hypothetical protein
MIVVGGALRRGAKWRDLIAPNHALTLCLLLAAYVFVNATWSADPSLALRRATIFAIIIVVSFVSVNAARCYWLG